jgi:ankyrin repeat protein
MLSEPYERLRNYLADSSNYNKFENWDQTNLFCDILVRKYLREAEIQELLDLLYQQGFNLNLKFHRVSDDSQVPVLNLVMLITKFSFEFREKLVHQLVGYGVDVNDTDSDGETPLMCCAFTLEGDCAINVMHLLLAQGANPNVLDNKGKSVLRVTTLHDKPALCQVLLEHGVDEDSKNEIRHCSIIDEIIMLSNEGQTNGANIIPVWAQYSKMGLPSLFDYKPYLYLDNAVAHYNSNMVRTLLPLVSDIKAEDEHGRTALIILLHQKHFTRVLPENKKRYENFCENLEDLILLALKHGASVTKKDNNGFTILFLAVMNNMPGVVHAILSKYSGNINHISNYQGDAKYRVTALEYNLRACLYERYFRHKNMRRHIAGMLWHGGAFLNFDTFRFPTTTPECMLVGNRDRELLVHMLKERERWMDAYYTRAQESVRRVLEDMPEICNMIRDFI